MANPIEDVKGRVLIGQLSILLYSVFAAILGKTATTFILVFILIIIISIIQNRSGPNPVGQAKTKPETVLSGRKVFEEENARDLQMKDTGLMADMQEQSKFTMYTSLGMLLAFVYFFALWGYVDDLERLLAPYLGQGRLTVFTAFLIYFEGLFVINQLVYIWALRKVGKVVMVQAPPKYTVTDKGIVLRGLTGGTAITFPLPEDVEVNVNEKRRFVELVKHYKKTVMKIRLYTTNPKRLAEVIKRYGVKRSS
ncbi:MAG: DUF2208 domain-containing protein [Desulfurococcales archaeon]|nr:DUF2208 domain-containing protein [Desulfurococcales archaeon]